MRREGGTVLSVGSVIGLAVQLRFCSRAVCPACLEGTARATHTKFIHSSLGGAWHCRLGTRGLLTIRGGKRRRRRQEEVAWRHFKTQILRLR